MSLIVKKFEGFDQNDSHEFLTYLLDSIHQELKNNTENETQFDPEIKPEEEISKNYFVINLLIFD